MRTILLITAVVVLIGLQQGCDQDEPLVGTPEPEPVELDLESDGIALVLKCLSGPECQGFVKLYLDGTLRVIKAGETPPRLYVAPVTSSDLEHVVTLSQGEAVVKLVSGGVMEFCVWTQDDTYITWLFMTTSWADGDVALCHDRAAELEAALLHLADKYVGGYEVQ